MIFLTLSMASYIYVGGILKFIVSNISFAALLATLTRSCWVGFGVMTILGGISILKRKNCIKRALIILGSFLIIFVAINVTSNERVSSRTESLKNEIVNKEERSGSGRLDIWNMIGKVIKNHPIIGVGPENLNNALREETPNELKKWEEATSTTIDRAHNEYLQIAVNSGIPSLIIYLIMIMLILKNIYLNIKDDRYKIIGLMIIGYLVQAFFNISVVGVAPLFWILLGLSTNKEEVEKISLS
ncbi:MAG: O-antigen ligase family protein [Clostridium sp.]